jgi:hypothetical protein
MSQLIKALSITVHINEMLSKGAPLTPKHEITDKQYYTFKCSFHKIEDDKGYEIFYSVKYCKGFSLFPKWADAGIFSIYSEGRIQMLIDQCEQFLIQKGHDVIVGKSSWS